MTEIHKGLAGVVVDTTAISSVDPESNSLLYRGYPADQLAERCVFEEVAYLLWHGELPTPDELAAFQGRGRSQRALPGAVIDAVLALPTTCHPMDVVRTAVSIIGAHDPSAQDPSPEANLAKSVRLLAQIPAVVAVDQRRRRGLDPIEPRDDLKFADNLFWMTFGEVPDPVVLRAFEVSLVLYAEHSFNASTFTARVIASTLSDLHSAVTGAVGALKGPLHGGANEAVMATFAQIGTADRAAAWLDAEIAAKRKVMGFGHRVYKHGDSRVPTMRRWLGTLVEHYDRPDLLDLYLALEDAMAARTGILPNLDYPTGPAYHLMGFDTPTFTPLFAASRVVGWTAHVMEQLASNSLIRPLSLYDGPPRREVPARP
ncbi:bifunctional 2-methylcitrate synthase/citrate synthase [Cellulomonas fimi]|uniref:Citrate synthase n=1 Tax=Cellulomonas fimi (strain ATCC 484 / DSM 20113 / JCM 1341 / CCUG 24087 / LMG 16345 / NBRC 15513 / NCIMB 8980 / NCTC 7547 / NRS-133) TaxID=590998 RepID=F4H571_CELFA|nr:bifunctional 2-methylcitrate synthase/citrate synthase [Cellulomonas fimi]AEE46677.1 2-methylcitrate synthase/citrate synthase II [Cellulomonas fimi ATCC 484]NNH07678.1 bifunctional 2-methylcitrate synthase/citrate synthase [Cellulomonas fimi]VEH33855.1 Citrate synthase [Cellulomonas fimi]